MNILAEGLSPEGAENLWLITIPTVLLAIVTIWTNDRLVKITLKALSLLAPPRRRRRKVNVAPVVNVEVQVHGRHEAPEGEEHHGFTFNRIEADWDKELANMTKGHTPEVWPHGEHTVN